MASFAYQSFESSSSKTHDARAIFQRNFTRKTNARVIGEEVEALIAPVNPEMPSEIYQGPSEKAPVEPIQRGITPTIAHLQQHIGQMFRNGFSHTGVELSAFVCGELDVRGTDFDPMRAFPNLDTHISAADKNCQCFTGFVRKEHAGTTKPLVEGPSYCVFTIDGMTVAFVHVPNAICKNEGDTRSFYSGIWSAATNAGADGVDIVIGDTNQQRPDFTKDCMNGLGLGTFVNAQSGSSVSPLDAYAYTAKGTNSGGDKMYDVCVYNTERVVLDQIAYLSQSSTGTTVTDHMGMIVKAHLI